MTSIIVVGSGNVANGFCKLIQQSNSLLLKAIVARNDMVGNELATTYGTSFFNLNADHLPEADLVIIAVSDASIAEVASANFTGKYIMAHTAGAIAMTVLAPYAKFYGVLYPLQSINKKDKHMSDFPILYDGSDTNTTQQLAIIASELSPESMQVVDVDRSKYHLSAVFVNNFGNHLFTVAYDYCTKNDLDFSLLLPLIKATALKVTASSPSGLQTGPAIRNDTTTIEKHKELLEGEEEMKKMYDLFTTSIRGRKK